MINSIDCRHWQPSWFADRLPSELALKAKK